MDKAKKTIITSIIIVTAVLGTFVINSIVLQFFDGKTIGNGYLLTLIDCILYSVWFLILALVGVMLLNPKPFSALAVAAVGVFCFLTFSGSVWVTPEASYLEKVIAYFQVYIATSMVLPIFIFVGLFAQRRALNNQ